MRQIMFMTMILLLVACISQEGGVSNGPVQVTETSSGGDTSSEPYPGDGVEPVTEVPPTDEPSSPGGGEGGNIIQRLEELGSFTILLTALQQGDMIDQLSQENLTLFAPEDDAFAKLPQGTVEELLVNPELLQSILSYHVVPQALTEEELIEAGSVQTLQAEAVTVKANEPNTKVNNANLIEADILAENGIIQVIDTVLMSVAPPAPPEPADLMPDIEVWIPYAPGVPLPIEDAELTPGAPAMRAGVERLSSQLQEHKITINTARTVRLEEGGEITYLAPVGPLDEAVVGELKEAGSLWPQDENNVMVGALVLDGQVQGEYGPGPFLLYVTGVAESNPVLLLIDAGGEAIAEVETALLDDDMSIEDVPSAAIFFGTRYCKIWGTNWFTGNPYHVCWACGIFGTFDTQAACIASG